MSGRAVLSLTVLVFSLLYSGTKAYPSACMLPTPQPGGPRKPAVSNQFTVYVEAVMMDKNQTIEYLEHFDYDNNRGRLTETKDGKITDYYYDYSTNEMLIVKPDDYTCQVQTLSKSPFVFIMGDANSHIFSPAAALRFGGAGSQEVYIGHSSVRGVWVNQWQSCINWPERNATMAVIWSFVDNVLWMPPASLDYPPPVECHVTGQVYSNDQSFRSFEHRYEFIHFVDSLPSNSDEIFEVPQGIVCPGRKNTKQLPALPDAFSFTGETITLERKILAYTEETYDRLGRLMAYTFSGVTGFSLKYGTGETTVIHDFNTGTEYVVDRERGNCSLSTISRTPDVGSQSDLVTLRLKTSRDLLDLTGNYTYMGVRTIRSMPCDVWVAEKGAKDFFGLSINATFEWAFLTSNWQTQDSSTAMFASGVPVQRIVTLDDFGARQTSVTNVYDFKASVPHIADDVNLDSCFIGLPRNAITFSIARIYKKLLKYFMTKFKYAVRLSISQSISVSSLRIANIAYRVQQTSLDVSFDLLSLAPVHSEVVNPTTELPLDQATERLTDAVKNNRLVIELDIGDNSPTFIVADPRSLRVLRLNQMPTVVTGVNPVTSPYTHSSPWVETTAAVNISNSSSSLADCDQYTTEGYSVGVMVGSALAMSIAGGLLGWGSHRLSTRRVR